MARSLPVSALDSSRPSPSAAWPEAAAPWLAAGFVLLWAGWAVLFNTAQYGDNLEQFNWAHGLEWGYFKHPPMPTWLLHAAQSLFGPSRWWAIGLAALCALATAAFTASIARHLLGPRAAAAVLLLWGLQLCFSSRVQLYNHNSVLVMFFAAAVWCALQARRRPGWWLAVGLCAGASMLTKYQAALPLAGLIYALWRSGSLRDGAQRLGLALAVLIGLLVFAPHVLWVIDHDFSTLRYASQSMDDAESGNRFKVLLSFVANQLRMIAPLLVTALVCWLLARRRPRALDGRGALASGMAPAPRLHDWLVGLLWGPLLVLVLLDLLAGVTLRNHWGVQALQFVTLWMAWRWQHALLSDLRRLTVVAIAVQCIGLGYYVVEHRDPGKILSSRRMDTFYPAQRMADEAMAVWQGAASACPLRFVAGPSFPAGLISLYSGGSAAVFEGEKESPWVDPAELRRAGAIVVAEGDDPLPDGVPVAKRLSLAPGGQDVPQARWITLGVRPPQAPCR